MATVVAVIRRRIKARESEDDGIVLNDYGQDDEGLPAPSSPSFGGYAQPQPAYSYPSAPVWGGQAVATTPMVLMTQTGEPVVVQVAYM